MTTTTSPTDAISGGGSNSDEGVSTPEGGSPQRELPEMSSTGSDAAAARTNGAGTAAVGAFTDFDVETLDESEFNLPPVATPTLQSILDEMQNDDDEFEIAADDASTIFGGDRNGSSHLGIGTGVVYGASHAHSDTTSVTTSSQEDILTGGVDWVWRRKRAGTNAGAKKVHGAVLKKTPLKGMSAQLASAAERANAGLPTAIAVSRFVAVGTSSGLVLIFDAKQVLKAMLDHRGVLGANSADFGGVTSLDFNQSANRILVGYARGQILMWDPLQSKLLRTISDAHPAGTAILHVNFTDDPTYAVFCDSGGSIFELEFKRNVIAKRTAEARCLFSGSRGEWVNVQPLHLSDEDSASASERVGSFRVKNNLLNSSQSQQQQLRHHPLKRLCIVALAKLNKVYIAALRPKLSVVYSHPLTGDPNYLPLLAWQLVPIVQSVGSGGGGGKGGARKAGTRTVMEPVLAFAKENTVYLVQAVSSSFSANLNNRSNNNGSSSSETLRFSLLQTVSLTYSLTSLRWFNSRTLAFLDVYERLHVVDAKSEEELESMDASEAQLVYGSSAFKSIATGGNVSQALAYAAAKACYHSIGAYNGQLVVLGSKIINVYTIRNWMGRIDNLVKHNQWDRAFALALSFYKGEARAVVGLAGSQEHKRQLVADKILDLLHNFLELATTSLCPERGTIDVLVDHYQNVVPIFVEHAIEIERIDFLFVDMFDKLKSDSIAKGVFLEVLEPYILSDRLPNISPTVMKDLIIHYEARGMISSIESCIPHVEVGCLDVHQVITACTTHALYDAYFYVFNAGMNDFTSPLEELLSTLEASLLRNDDDEDSSPSSAGMDEKSILLGNKLLVYISCCLAGRAYPMGDIAEHLIVKVKDDIYHFLVTPRHQGMKAQLTSSPSTADDEDTYPYIRTFLLFDTREFLNVLTFAFEEPEFTLQRRQAIVDILLKVMVESIGFAPGQIGLLFTFLARQMAKHEEAEEERIHVPPTLFGQVFEFLCGGGGDEEEEEGEGMVPSGAVIDERQEAVLELLHVSGFSMVDEDVLLEMAETAKFHQVCELIYERKRQFHKILALYWNDDVKRSRAVFYAEQVLSSSAYSSSEKALVREEALDHVASLIAIDNRRAAALILNHFPLPETALQVLESLAEEPKDAYAFLEGFFLARESLLSENGANVENDDEDSRSHSELPSEIFERFLELMCDLESEGSTPKGKVVEFLKSTLEIFDEKVALNICKSRGNLEAAALLLERSGKILDAFDLLREDLDRTLKRLLSSSNDDVGGVENTPEVESRLDGAAEVATNVIEFAQRHSPTLGEEQREKLWFALLEVVMKARASQASLPRNSSRDETEHLPLSESKQKEQTIIEERSKSLTCHVLNAMMTYVSPPSILTKIINDNNALAGVRGRSSSGVHSFVDMKHLLLSMLETFSYEKVLFSKTKNVLVRDLNDSLGQLAAVSSRALTPSDDACSLTGRPWSSVEENDSIIVFQCGHAYLTSALVDASGGETSSRESFSEDFFSGGGANTCRCYVCSVSGGGSESASGTLSSIDDMGVEKNKRGRTRRISNYFSWFSPLNQNPPSSRGRNSKNANDIGARLGGGESGHLDAAQVDAVRLWKSTFRTPDRLRMLQTLKSSAKSAAANPFDDARRQEQTEQSVYRKNNFSLRLKPKPLLPVD